MSGEGLIPRNCRYASGVSGGGKRQEKGENRGTSGKKKPRREEGQSKTNVTCAMLRKGEGKPERTQLAKRSKKRTVPTRDQKIQKKNGEGGEVAKKKSKKVMSSGRKGPSGNRLEISRGQKGKQIRG